MALAHGNENKVIPFKCDREKVVGLLGFDEHSQRYLSDDVVLYSSAEFLKSIQDIKNYLTWLVWPQEAETPCPEKFTVMTDKEKEQYRLYYEACLLELMKAFYFFLAQKTYADEALKKEQAKQAEAQRTGWQRFVSNIKFYLLASGAIVSEGSDGFLGGTTLLSKVIGGAFLLVAGVASALIHSAVHYMVTVNAMKRQLNIATKEHIVPLAKLHTEQIAMMENINPYLLEMAPINKNFGDIHEEKALCSYKDHANIAIELNEYVAKKNKEVGEYRESKGMWACRWGIGISEAIINGSFSFLAIKMTFLFILGGMAITPAGWALLAVMLVVITLASFATITNMLGDMNLGVRAALNPDYRQTNALFRKVKTYTKNNDFKPAVEKNIRSSIKRAFDNFGNELDRYFGRSNVDDQDISYLQGLYAELQRKVALDNKGSNDNKGKNWFLMACLFIYGDGPEKNQQRLAALGLRLDYLGKKKDFLEQANKTTVVEKEIDDFFKLALKHQQTTEAVSENGKKIEEFKLQLEKLVDCSRPFADEKSFNPQPTIDQFSEKLNEFISKQKEITTQNTSIEMKKNPQSEEVEKLTQDNLSLTEQIVQLKKINQNLIRFGQSSERKSADSPDRSPNSSPVKLQRTCSEIPMMPRSRKKLFDLPLLAVNGGEIGTGPEHSPPTPPVVISPRKK